MRVLIVNRMVGTLLGGGETFDLGVAHNLAKLGHDVTVVTAKPLFSRPLLFHSGLKIVYLPTPSLFFLEAKVRRFNQKLGAICCYIDRYIFEQIVFSWLSRDSHYSGYDIIQCCSMFWLPRWAITRFNIPAITWLPGPPSRLACRHIRDLVSYPHFGLFTHGDPVWVLENQLGFVRGIDFEVVEPGVDLTTAKLYDSRRDEIRSSLGILNETVVGATVARLISIKNIPFLIEGLERAIRELRTPIVWLMVGEGPERPYLERLTKVKKLESYIRWLGHLQRDEIHRILAAADIFALTSAYESFSIATLEAMAHGLPIVATSVGYLKELVKESGGGVWVNVGDVEGLAQAIVKLIRDPGYREHLGKKGQAYVQRFDWLNIIAKLLRFYERVIDGRLSESSRSFE